LRHRAFDYAHIIHFQIRKASHYPLDSAHSTGYEYAVFVL
jgi:hypothetical protein